MTGEETTVSILSRITRELRRRDWTSVAVEILIVVLGVFLGIQAANWNESRHDRLEERRYYRQIAVDLRRDVEQLRVAQARSRIHDKAAENVLNVLDGKLAVEADPSAFAKNVHYAGFLFLPSPSRRTYDELVGTGNLGLLRDDRMKGGLAAYYEEFAELKQWDSLLRQQQAEYWSTSAGIVPRRVLQAATDYSDLQVSAAEAAEYLARARATPDLRPKLIGMAAHQARVRRDSIGLEQDARNLITNLEALGH